MADDATYIPSRHPLYTAGWASEWEKFMQSSTGKILLMILQAQTAVLRPRLEGTETTALQGARVTGFIEAQLYLERLIEHPDLIKAKANAGINTSS